MPCRGARPASGSSDVFNQDHKADFDAVLSATDPFALIRFGDGELAVIDGIKHQSADSWATSGPVWIRDELIESLRTTMDGFCIGLPSGCCISRGIRLRYTANAPTRARTFATLFMHGNLRRAGELQEHFSDAVVVNSSYGEIRIPDDGVTEQWDLDAVVRELLEIRGRPILLAAGPCANLIAYRYWQRQERRHRVPILDVGSALDVTRGQNNRHYHGKMNDHHCTWAPDRPMSVNPTKPKVVATARVRIGRKASTNGIRMQGIAKRLRLGKI